MTARPLFVRPADWALRNAPRGVLAYYLVTELAALTFTLLWPGHSPTGSDWARFGTLLVIGVVQTELSRGTEQIRRYFAGVPHVNMTSVWIGAGAFLLPPPLAALLTALIYGHLWLRVWRPITSRPAYRALFSASTMVLACLVVGPVLRAVGVGDTLVGDRHGFVDLVGIVAAILAFTTVNSLLIMVGLKLHGPERSFLALIGSWADNALEIATLCLGGATAALLAAYPTLVPLMVLPVVVLHRCVLMRQLQELATQDSKTGLLTNLEWRNRAAGELVRAERGRTAFAVLIVDLDNFKLVNDTHGHLAGDAVLRAVADAIRGAVRSYDSVGRFGGEEFVVLLPEMPDNAACAIAERIRRAITCLDVSVDLDGHAVEVGGLSASIGVAAYPDAGTAIDRILHAADTAMYRAKANGRNQVVSVTDV
jgi:diguanylate cyclase (GGDEF)-like protein